MEGRGAHFKISTILSNLTPTLCNALPSHCGPFSPFLPSPSEVSRVLFGAKGAPLSTSNKSGFETKGIETRERERGGREEVFEPRLPFYSSVKGRFGGPTALQSPRPGEGNNTHLEGGMRCREGLRAV